MDMLILTLLMYLIGGINASILLCRIMGKRDPRTTGSKNAGSTNVLRAHGAVLAGCTLLLDMLKGCIPIYGLLLSHASMTNMPLWTTALCLGHVFPLFFGFRGGKGVAVTAGIALALAPFGLLVGLCIWGGIVRVTRLVSLASILASMALAFYPWLFPMAHPWSLTLPCIIVVMAHHSNMKRLVQKTEKKIQF